MNKSTQLAAMIVLLIVVTAGIFSPTLQSDFLNWDDPFYTTQNRDVVQFNFKYLVTEYYMKNYHPLTMLSLSVDYALAGDDPLLYHLNNLLLHMANSILVMLLMIRFFSRTLWVGFMGGLLFALHPLHVESVAWIAERKDVLSTFFFLLAFLTYFKYLSARRPARYYLLCFFFFLLALFSKSMVVTLPVLLILVDLKNRRGSLKRIVIDKIPFVVMSVLFSVINIDAQRVEALVDKNQVELAEIPEKVMQATTLCLSKALVPIRLCSFYDDRIVKAHGLDFALAALVLGGLVLLIVWLKKNPLEQGFHREILFGLLFFLITFAPTSGLIPFSKIQLVADRYFYIPSIGLLYCFALVFYALRNRWPNKVPLVTVLAALFIAGNSYLAWERTAVWKNSETFWQDTIRQYPEVEVAHYNLGTYYLENNRTDEAVASFKKAIDLKAEHRGAHYNLGAIYEQRGLTELAIEKYRKVTEIDPKLAKAWFGLGSLLANKGMQEEAMVNLNQCLKVNPNHIQAHVMLANLYLNRKQYPSAVEHMRQAMVMGYRVGKKFLNQLPTSFRELLTIKKRE